MEMKLSGLTRSWISMAACYAVLSAQLVQAATPPVPPAAGDAAPAVRDVALHANGVLAGQVLDAQGAPLARVAISVMSQGKEIAKTQTDANGTFTVAELKGGVYSIVTPIGTSNYRAWSPRTAPPAAAQAALIVPDDAVVRGRFGTGALGWLANPWVLAAIVAAAIAIPLALDDDDDAS
jgi:hypothetical protein